MATRKTMGIRSVDTLQKAISSSISFQVPTHYHISVYSLQPVKMECIQGEANSVIKYNVMIQTLMDLTGSTIHYKGEYVTSLENGDIVHRRPCSKQCLDNHEDSRQKHRV